MTFTRLATGKKGEDEAVKELLRRGYHIITRNYRCRFGEIDIIGEKNHQLVFIEVKTRTTLAFGLPQENVNYRKQTKIRRVAQMYLVETRQFHRDISFCVVAVQLNREGKIINIEVIEEAF
ncbi:MAG: YraN family protein [Bacillota bacterium]|jgi:putative endonuclease|nr:YraN family protein [Clostridia bacterium]